MNTYIWQFAGFYGDGCLVVRADDIDKALEQVIENNPEIYRKLFPHNDIILKEKIRIAIEHTELYPVFDQERKRIANNRYNHELCRIKYGNMSIKEFIEDNPRRTEVKGINDDTTILRDLYNKGRIKPLVPHILDDGDIFYFQETE